MRSKPMSILRLATYATLALGAFVSLLPLVTVLLASFKDVKEFGLSGALDLPKSWLYLQNYATAWTKAKMPLAFWNTSLILFFTLIGSVITGTMVAYIINRFSFKGRNLVKAAFLVANLIPGVTMQVSTYQIMTALGLVNSIPGIVILYTGTDIIAIYIFLQFFESIPRSLDEAAYIDGASYFTIFFRILFPLVKPATVTVLILKGVSVYKEYYLANLYLQSKTRYVTISTSLYTFTGEYGNQYNYICAGVMITIIPILIAFLFLQRYIYNGIARGAVKE
ncbi:MAG: carbohydrate ABC transporter permease [Sphaerochaeta sp.]|jgi:multiple sugar transport system permease protein|uniref:Carbohydrate ABC transporter permease n=1 Tax=Sphaerochaeta associata TaxID=1129264 RepID=A0ABY4DFD8_9SPIR|nr:MULTISPECIES: carbohydrate ABC transporter permease [Sphaerochaeta]MDD3424977.1 carbohydrate ABC transporter permease [Sphaerochaeta sp.]MDD4038657.1 carbohydrate ABC transporter permease [Sphaerochaeta sp.]MDX9985309.1 carbohydrate ABC transporter permease [Sphaerochaeta sp.]UOM51657.1 carbohydrate ABC transporter permease [Sphaerochaeta associata]SMP52442.1 carbohydrate ABC transporter membrane protein 2, CUT1 family [Sphaerochaeta associata]